MSSKVQRLIETGKIIMTPSSLLGIISKAMIQHGQIKGCVDARFMHTVTRPLWIDCKPKIGTTHVNSSHSMCNEVNKTSLDRSIICSQPLQQVGKNCFHAPARLGQALLSPWQQHAANLSTSVRLMAAGSDQSSNVINESESVTAEHEKPQKGGARIKEFVLKSNIGLHDLNIKLKHISGVLLKGKAVKVIMRKSYRFSKDFASESTAMQKKIQNDLKDICTVHQDHKTEKAAQFSLRPLAGVKESPQ